MHELNSNKNLNLDISNIKSIESLENLEYLQNNNFVYIVDLNKIKKVHSLYQMTRYRYEKI